MKCIFEVNLDYYINNQEITTLIDGIEYEIPDDELDVDRELDMDPFFCYAIENRIQQAYPHLNFLRLEGYGISNIKLVYPNI